MILSPLVKQRFSDDNNLPLAGGKLYTYAAGTTTPQVTYSNQAGTTNTNPVILDAYGYADVWLDPSKAYKFILQDVNGNVLWTLDNIAPVSGGISSGTASASFSSGILVVNQAPNTPATVQCGSIKVGNTGSAISNFCTISPVNSLSANYSLVLPPVSPSGTQLLTIDTSGNISPNTGAVSATVANNVAAAMTSTGADSIASVMDATGANAIGSVMTSTGANPVHNARTTTVTTNGSDPGAGGVVVSASCGGNSVNIGANPAAPAWPQLTNMLVTLTTRGRPVFVGLIDDRSNSGTGFTASGSLTFVIARDATIVASTIGVGTYILRTGFATGTTGSPTEIQTIDYSCPAGTHTYAVGYDSPSGTSSINNFRLIAYEL